ncbi:MAG: non-heme iron oxygenase ferredoxin subunit [Actinomycetota bacterium]|nr:non-heme iron oxygenase ferredoxin subunit [Actinomycetota bacterium]
MEPLFVRVGSLAEVPDGEVRGYELDGIRVAVAHLDGQVHALGDECTHRSCSLSEGELEPGGSVVCPCHGSRFDLESGEPLDGPAAEPVPVYPARVEDGWVEVAVTAWDHNGREA